MPIVFFFYYSAGTRERQNLVLVISSYVFYASWDWRFCSLLLATSAVDFFVGSRIYRSGNISGRKRWLMVSLFWNLGALGFFKYFNFFIDSFIRLGALFGMTVSDWSLNVILPVGVSFLTFTSLTYTIGVYRGEFKPTGDLAAYFCFVSFFPKLAAGPIERAETFLPQFYEKRLFDYSLATEGLKLIMWGLLKKMVVADNLSLISDKVFNANPLSQGGSRLAIGAICFSFQIYYDFSGYSDIAIGSSALFGIKLMRNFAYPYFSRSPAEFWRRWHISLTSWFRDYVFIPLGGSRRATARKIINVMTTFLLSGLWHGASLNFVVWGGINGLGVLPETVFPPGKKQRATDVPGTLSRLPCPAILLRMALTFIFICATWIFFRAPSLRNAIIIIYRIPQNIWTPGWYLEAFKMVVQYRMTIFLCAAFITLEWIGRREMHLLSFRRLSRPARWLLYTLIFWIIMCLGTHMRGQFVYFRF